MNSTILSGGGLPRVFSSVGHRSRRILRWLLVLLFRNPAIEPEIQGRTSVPILRSSPTTWDSSSRSRSLVSNLCISLLFVVHKLPSTVLRYEAAGIFACSMPDHAHDQEIRTANVSRGFLRVFVPAFSRVLSKELTSQYRFPTASNPAMSFELASKG